jgi:hypothetical protein
VGKPNHAFVGVLNFNPSDGLTLRVVHPTSDDNLQAVMQAMANGHRAAKKVCAMGHTYTHGHISLFDGFESSGPGWRANCPTERVYFFNRGLLGLASTDPSQEKVSSIDTRSEFLRVWLNQQIVKCDRTPTANTVIVHHTRPEPIKFQVDTNNTLILGWDRSGPISSVAQSSVEITSRPWIRIDFAQPQSVNCALNEIHSAAQFISLLAGVELVPSVFKLGLPEEDMRQQVEPIYFLSYRRQEIIDRSRELTPWDLLFTFPVLETRIKSLATKWFEFQKNIPGCMNVFFSAHHNAYTNQRFFALTTVVESLHRHLTHKRATLLTRVKEFIEQSSILLVPDVVGDKDIFAKRVVAWRNNEAHFLKGDGSSGLQHLRLASKLRVIIDALIMQQLGLPISEVASAMKKNRQYWFYASNETWPWDVGTDSREPVI